VPVLNPEQYRVVHRLWVEEAEPLLNAHDYRRVAFSTLTLMGVEGVWAIERLRRRNIQNSRHRLHRRQPV